MGKYHSKILMLFNLDFLSSIVLNFIKTDSRMTSAVLNIAEKCLTVTAVTSLEESFIVFKKEHGLNSDLNIYLNIRCISMGLFLKFQTNF